MNYTLCTFAERPELRPRVEQLERDSWPPFLLHGNVRSWHLLFEPFAACQLLLCGPGGELLAVGHTVPLFWDGSFPGLPVTIEEIIIRAARDHDERRPANALTALAAMVDPKRRGQRLSVAVVREMKALADRQGCRSLIAPVRPTWKSRFPLEPMDRYVERRQPDGSPFDPWLRVHWRLGALPLGLAPATVTVAGTIKEWREWTGLAFPASGSYVVAGALQPVHIDRERDLGRYEDPNYWMAHSLQQGSPYSEGASDRYLTGGQA